jgi:hypothetical protein
VQVGPAEAGKEGEGADSLASPGARSPAAARCVLCHAALAAQDGTPKLMECLHSACEPCITAKLEERQPNSRDFLGEYGRLPLAYSSPFLLCYYVRVMVYTRVWLVLKKYIITRYP